MVLSILACSVFFSVISSDVKAQAVKAPDVLTLKERIVTVPAGFGFNAFFMMPVSSATSYTGQEVTLALGTDLYYKDKLIAPAGSAVQGTVIETFKAKHGALNGKLVLRFTHIITPSGLDIPISAIIKTDDKTGALFGGSSSEGSPSYISASGKAIHSITAAHYPVNSNSSVYTGSVGAGGGLFKSVWDKGNDVEIPVNAQVELILLQPITVNPSLLQNE